MKDCMLPRWSVFRRSQLIRCSGTRRKWPRRRLKILSNLFPTSLAWNSLGFLPTAMAKLYGNFALRGRDGKHVEYGWSDGKPFPIDGGFLDHSIESRTFDNIGDAPKRVVLVFYEDHLIDDIEYFKMMLKKKNFSLLVVVIHGAITVHQAIIVANTSGILSRLSVPILITSESLPERFTKWQISMRASYRCTRLLM